MKKMWKRFVSLLLACTLLAGMLPLSASAAVSAPGEGSEQYKYAESILNKLNESITNEQEKYGLYGPALLADSELYTYSLQRSIYDKDSGKWTTDTQYILVPGVDAQNTTTPNYNGLNSGQPWAESNPSAIYIAEGVTGIGNYAFASRPSLNNVVFQDASDLTYIGQRAFYDDDNAVFTDEGNEGENATLDLSSVTTMGEYAFYNCDKLTGVKLGNMTAIEGNEEIPNKIPNNAFNNSGLQTVTIPDGIQHIGDGAFGHTSLSKVEDLVLPDGLKTIGDNAFVVTMGSGDTSVGITSLTIPSSVESIGDNAFSGRRKLAEVTVEDDNEPGTTLTLGNAAFGFNESSAYATQGSIRDEQHPEIEYSGTIGTKFFLPEDLEKYFVNEVKCYTGDITPMKYVDTEPADCINAGYDIYKTTFNGATSDGKPVELTYHYPIPALGHDYGPITEVERTCEHDNYFEQYCERKNCPNKGVAVGSLRQNQEGPGLFDEKTNEQLSEEELNEYRLQFVKAEGHNWSVKSVVNPNMQEGQATTLYYVCENEEHRNGLDTYDSPFKIPLSGKTINALTTQSLNDLTNQLAGFSNDGMVEWAAPSDEKFGKAGEINEPVKFTIQTGVTEKWPVFTEAPEGEPNAATGENEKLTVKINVTKDVLDLSGVSIVPNTANVNKPVEVRVSGFEEAEKTGSVEYYVGDKWITEQPKTEGKYKVRVTFKYDEKMYDLPEESASEYPGEGYKLVNDKDSGSVWVEHSFEVSLNKINAVAESISNLTYNGEKQNTLRIYGLEIGQKAVVTTTDKDGTEIKWEYTRQEGDQTTPVEGLSLLSAGTYNVKVVFSFPGEDSYADKEQELTVHIDHKPVEKPVPTQNMSYLPVKTARDAFGGQTSADWQFVDDGTYTHTGINAGSYTAKVKLTSDNYRWADENEDVREIEIPWTISPRQIVAPTLASTYYIYEYGIWRNSLFLTATAHPNYEFVTNQEDHTVKLVFVGNKTDENYDPNAAVAYTAADAYHTNRDDYTVIVTLNNSGNYVWWNGAPQNLTWTIAPATLNLPKIEAEGADYTGEPYDAESLVTVKNDGVTLPGDVESEGYQYSNDATFRSPSNNAPINAGTYYVRQNYTYNNQNYIAQIPYASFTINKATAQMTFTEPKQEKTYTAEGTALQLVEVSGLVGQDTGKEETVKKEVQYSYKYSETKVEDWSTVANSTSIKNPESQKFKEVGYYQITAKWGAGSVSDNYRADPATYTLTIKKAEDQSITLTPDKPKRWTAAEGQTPAKYTITYGEAATFTVIGKAALDNASISYAVNGDSNVVSVDGRSGVVTIHKAGTATITVTAADTANVAGASVDYTVTVKKATPTVNTNLTDDKLTVTYTGNPIEGYDEAEATATVVDEAEQPTGPITYTFYTDAGCSDENKVTNGGGAESNIPIAVGTYYMKLTYDGDTNYESAELKGVPVTVTKARLTVDAEGYAATYDGKDHPAITVDSVKGNSEEITGYTVKYAVTNNDTAPNENAGEEVWKGTLPVKDVADSSSGSLYYWYMVTADNYNPAIGKVDVKIAPAPLTVAGEPTRYTKEYDGDKAVDEAFDKITVTAENVPDVTIDVAATGTYADKNAGEGKNVTLNLTLSGTDTWGNYSYNGTALTEGEITLTQADAGTITPKEITVTGISAVDRVYDGTTDVELKGTPETTDKVGSDDLTLTLTSNATGSIESADVGNDKAVTVETSVITLGGDDANNYKVSAVKDAANGDVKVNITQRPVNLEFAGIGQDGRIIEKAYTGQPVNVTVGPVASPAEGTGFIDSDQLKAGDVDYTYMPVDPTTDTDHTAVGSYTVTAALKADPTGNYDNYELKFPDAATLKITPAEMVVDAQSYTGTYTGKAHNVTDSWTAKTTDGDQPITITGVQFIKKDEQHNTTPEADAEGWAEISFTNVAQSGKYWYKVTAENYSPMVGDDAVTITINPATLTINRAVTPTKTYDGTVDADEQVTDVGVMGQQNNEAITATVTSAFYNSAEVGSASKITITYKLEAKDGANLANYKLNGKEAVLTSGTVTEEVTKVNNTNVAITQKPIEVSINDQSKVYDGQFATASSDKGTAWTVNEDDLCELVSGTKDNLGITLSVASGSKDAGTYAIIGEADNDNYKVTFTGNWAGEGENKDHAGTYTIEPRPINVQIGNAEGFYGDVPDVTMGDKVILEDVTNTEDVSEDGLVQGEDIHTVFTRLTLRTNAIDTSPVGNSYRIYPVNNDSQIQAPTTPTQLGNYEVTFTNEGTYTVKPRPITITIADHSSVYGEEIDDGIASPASGTDYQVSLTKPDYTGSGTSAIVNNDVLTVTLETTASAKAAAGTYDITGSAEGNKVNNYAITWAGNGGNRDGGGKNGKYTIEEAKLAISFEKGNQVLNGVSINITDSYNANPLVLKNASTDAEVSEADKSTLGITYSIGTAGGGTGDVSQIAEIDKTTGEVTILKTGTVRITATVTPQGNSNYTGQVTTWYELNIISGGQMTLNVTPETGLAYTGEPQPLIEKPICSLDSAEIHYSLDNQKWEETIPTGTNASTYTVYVKATDPSGQYSDVTEHVTVTIDKADLKGRFAQEEYTHVLTTGTSYDSATANPLTITSQNYTGNADAYTYRSNDTDVAIAVNGGSTIRVLGSAGQSAEITVTVPGDNNYNGKTFTYTLEISEKLSEIKYSVENDKVTYNGQPQTIAVNVTAPASGATVRYWNESTNAYDQTEPPAYTDVQDSGTTIKFQITAPGYKTVTDEATLTIKPRDINLCQVEGIAASYTFVNKPIEPQTVEVVDGSVILKEDTDYTITYGANTEVGEDKGSVIIKGTGNYTGSVTKNFEITPVDASDLTASLDRTFGYYRNSENNNATVTVTHGSHEVTSDGSNTVSIAVKDNTGADVTNQSDVVSINDQTVTFNQVGTYTIEVTVTGNHATNAPIQLTYALLLVEKGELVLEADNETSIVATYGEPVNGDITVTDANGKPMTESTDYSLTYTYTPFEGNGTSGDYTSSVMEGTPAAGMYVVTATGQGGYVNSVGTFTFLILQRDLSKAILDVNDTDLVFNHDEKKPDVTVAVTGDPTADDYTITYYNNVNASNAAKAVVTATGNNFTGSKTEDFTIAPKPITAEMVDDIPDQHYTGEEVVPPVTITDGNYTLILGYDYTTACEDKGPGAATVTITGTGNYTETTTKDFVIKSEGAPEPSERFDLAVRPSQWTWGDDLKDLALNVTFGTGNELDLGTEYTLEVNGQTFNGTTGKTKDDALAYIKSLKPGEYTITATGVGAYNGSNDAETVTIQKIQPEVTVTATPNSLSGGGKVTLTLKGEKLPAFAEGQDLSSLLTASAKDEKNAPDLSELEWETDEQTGVMTAELTLPNTSETYTFTLTFTGNEYYEAATASEQVVVAQQIISGGGGGPVEDQPANPDDTGVSDWLNTKEHLAYLAGYPGGIFGPDQNMTRAEAAQMFYNLLLEKDVEITVEFVDVPEDAWYATPVNTLASLGILSGVGNGRFDPERSITRAEFTVIAMKFANTSGGGVNIFSDVNEDDWFYSAVVDSTQYGWINGYPDGTFRPEATISRAEVTVIVNHMLGRAADRPYVIAHEEELNTFGDVNRGHWGYFHIAEATNAHEYHTEDGTESWTGLS